MPVKLRRVAAALILPAVLVTAACGKQAEPTPGASSAAATPTSRAAATDAPSAAQSSGQPYQDKAALIAGLKSGAASATSAHVTMDMKAAGQSLAMEGDTKLDATNPAMQVTMDMGPQMKLDMLLVDDKVFIKGIPGIPDGKWGVVDSSSELGKQLESSLAQADPTKMYDQFEKGVTAVKPLGEESDRRRQGATSTSSPSTPRPWRDSLPPTAPPSCPTPSPTRRGSTTPTTCARSPST